MYQSPMRLRLNTTEAFPGEFARQLVPMLSSAANGNPLFKPWAERTNKEKLP